MLITIFSLIYFEYLQRFKSEFVWYRQYFNLQQSRRYFSHGFIKTAMMVISSVFMVNLFGDKMLILHYSKLDAK